MTQTFQVTDAPVTSSSNSIIAGLNDIYLDINGNIAIAGKTQDQADQIEAVLQCCKTAALAQLGEMVLHVDLGIPNLDLIWNGSPNIVQWESVLRSTFLSVEGVQEVLSLSARQSGRVLSYSATIQTIYGQGTLNG